MITFDYLNLLLIAGVGASFANLDVPQTQFCNFALLAVLYIALQYQQRRRNALKIFITTKTLKIVPKLQKKSKMEKIVF